jgi:(p)ppGpp synthase/HD superfamily hydrolase
MTSRFSSALAFANDIHGTQTRKGTQIPYIGHLLAVAAIVIEAGGDEDTAIGALLHDAMEDQGGRGMLARIRDQFGPVVAEIVEECSDTDVKPKPPWQARKAAYIAEIATKSDRALLVSLADKIHNSEAILADFQVMDDALWERFSGRKDGTLWYYRALADAFRPRAPGALWHRLDRTVAALEQQAAGS